jgi:hypothetical protein
VLLDALPPPAEKWPSGILAFANDPTDLVDKTARRLVLRDAMAAPGRGVLYELFDPRLVALMDMHNPAGARLPRRQACQAQGRSDRCPWFRIGS